ncbi:relaxase/mobilization nuclease domain-containing protein [Citromicrobium bathyomarinum]|uniref:relaxase/mobilization nuclease domain-containing protein n=1 Tax=Citromicrobium bathyomarinum TaxID=72174 RepID=UPI00315B32EB
METAVDAYHADLLRYAWRNAHKEEVAATCKRNLRSDDATLIAAEMGALIEDADPTIDVVEHYIVSLREEESFGEHLDATVDTLLRGLGLQNCPAVAALHRDTDNEHIHLVVLRIDKDTGEIVDPLKYDIIRAHQMLAVLEAETGWSREVNARWQVQKGRLVLDEQTDIGPADDPSSWPDRYFPTNKLSSAARNKETKTGIESAERIVRRVVPGLIESHDNLTDLLKALQHEGISLSKKGSGAVYRVTTKGETGEARDEFVRCSVIRRWSYGMLRAKYGELPDEFGTDASPRYSRAVDGSPDRPHYAAMRAEYIERLNGITRSVRMALLRTPQLNGAIASGRSACIFPSLEAWRQGELPPDPGEVMFAHVGARIFEAPVSTVHNQIRAQPDDVYIAAPSKRRIIYQRRGSLMGPSRIVDFGNRIVLIGRASASELSKTMALFAARETMVVSATGLNKSEWKVATRVAASYGITLIAANRDRFGVGRMAGKTSDGAQHQPNSQDRTTTSSDDHTQHAARSVPETGTGGDRIDAKGSTPILTQRAQPIKPLAAEFLAWQHAEAAHDAARRQSEQGSTLAALGRELDRCAWTLERQVAEVGTAEIDLSSGDRARLAAQAQRHTDRIQATAAMQAGLVR